MPDSAAETTSIPNEDSTTISAQTNGHGESILP